MSAKSNPILQIDPEFESKIPPLTEDEYQQLAENIISEGVVLMPLIVWNGTCRNTLRSSLPSMKRTLTTAMRPLYGFATTSLAAGTSRRYRRKCW